MPVKAKLRLRPDTPFKLEHRLVTKGGFKVFSRKPNEWIILEKRSKPAFKVIEGELAEDIKKTLLDRCNNIINMFSEPELHIGVIRRRLENVCLTLSPLQRDFVHKWMDTYVVEED